MCGIIGYIGSEIASNVLLDGLKRLEYRGYDSSGIAVISEGMIELHRAAGKLVKLEKIVEKKPPAGTVGIGHTRWATHGKPCEVNAHPHTDCSGDIVVVHNGIIENYSLLKQKLISEGHTFKSETDTEVITHLVEKYFNGDLLQAVFKALKDVEGAYALGVVSAKDPQRIIAARNDCPLVIGLGKGEFFLASDIPAILHRTREVLFMNNGEVAELSMAGVNVFDLDGKKLEKKVDHITWDAIQAEKSGFRHFMLKEIHEQPETIIDTLRGRLIQDKQTVHIEEVNLSEEKFINIQKLAIVACGTSYHAGMVGKFLFEEIAQIPCEVDIASEFRYRSMPMDSKTLFITISQSGETADTLAALREASKKGCETLAICNVIGSSLAREAHGVLFTHCGPEIGVASTKAFTGQLTALYLLALYMGMVRKCVSKEFIKEYVSNLAKISHLVHKALEIEPAIKKLAKKFYKKSDFLYLGRHVNFPIALEGALKLKEISYIHAEGYPAGEMKHGPIALIDEKMPVLAIATKSKVYDKILSNIEEAKARGGIIISLATENDSRIKNVSDHVLYLPETHELFSPVVTIIPLQLLAYHIGVLRGCDVDQPRNLAKSVTVE